MIPPSANIVAALGAYTAIYGEDALSIGNFWIVCWGVSLWFVLSRFVQLFIFCKHYKIKGMAKEDVPSIRATLKESWSGLLLPVIILAPFIFDATCTDFIASRLGTAGAGYFSKSLLIFIGGIASVYGIVIAKNRKEMTPKEIISVFAKGVKGIVPTVATCILGYMIGELFTDLNVGAQLQAVFEQMDFGLVGLAFVIPLLTCFISMVIPGSSITVMLGSVFISIFANAGADPVMVAAMLPCICGVMCGITPPFALGMYAGMSIAKSDFTKTVKNDLWWVATQYLMEVIVLLGVLPILGL
jgi:TRAP-type C4-dicarboxylate transport system permease large subunit